MSYSYLEVRPKVIVPENFPMIIESLKALRVVTKKTGCITYINAMDQVNDGVGDSWNRMAVLDWFIEQGYFRAVPGVFPSTNDQIMVVMSDL